MITNTYISVLTVTPAVNTNSAKYEVSVLMAEANGQGIPLGFFYHVSTDGTASVGAKSRALSCFLRYYAPKCPNVKFTLSDKEIEEIKPLRAVFPGAKHISCSWHAVEAIKARLASDTLPGTYEPRVAFQLHSFIDPTWAPGVVEDGRNAEVDLSSGSVKPIREGDVEAELEEAKQVRELLFVWFRTRISRPFKATTTTCRRAAFILVDKTSSIRIPIWPRPPAFQKADLPEFCPKPFRAHILAMFRQHTNMHMAIPCNADELHYLTAEQIRESCVKDMYFYCFDNKLPQVWSYLWNNWYCPTKWVLWARSESDLISVLRTTMIVEGFWNGLKHTTLSAFRDPRLDLVTHLVITLVIPEVCTRLDYHLDRRRVGRPKQLARWQEDFKAAWEEYGRSDEARRTAKEAAITGKQKKTKAWREQQLAWIREDLEREAGTYHTSIEDWTCSCPSYLISRFLLCKHLVRAADVILAAQGKLLTLRDYYELRRRREAPFYIIPGVHVDASDVVIAAPRDELVGDSDDEPETPPADPSSLPPSDPATTYSALSDCAEVDELGRVCVYILIWP